MKAAGRAGGDDPGVVLHLAPHCDDELIGAPATLMALRDGGWTIANLVCSLGRPGEESRRRRELEEACRRAGFDVIVPEHTLGDPLASAEIGPAQDVVEAEIAAAVDRLDPRILVAPSPHDRHPGHEVVSRAAIAACERRGNRSPLLWMWGLWADLPFPTLAVAFGGARLDEILAALGAHSGELERNDYRMLVRGRAEMNASLGPERVFGFGARATAAQLVEVITEAVLLDGRWHLGPPRWLEPGGGPSPHGAEAAGLEPGGVDRSAPPRGGGVDITDWLHAPSLTSLYGPPGQMWGPPAGS